MEKEFILQTLHGHEKEITALAFSSDAKYLFTGSYDCNIAKWDLSNGKLVYKLNAHSSFVSSLATSPDSKYIVSGSSDHTAKIWDFESGSYLETLDYYRDSILCVLVSFDGKRIVTGGSGITNIWDSTSGQLIHGLEKGLASPHTLTISPVGEYVAGTRDRTVKIWNFETSKLVRDITKKESNQYHRVILFSPQGKNLIYTDDKNITIIDINNTNFQRLIRTPISIQSLDMSSDGKYLLGLAGFRFIYLWNFSTGELIKTNELPKEEEINILKFSPDAKYIVGGLRNGLVKVWVFTGDKGFNYETYLQVKEELAKRDILVKIPKETKLDNFILESEIEIQEPEDNLIFISYSTKDKDIFKIKEIAKQLTIFPEIRDALYWEEDMDDNIAKYMSENLEKCDVFLLFSSPNALTSKPIEKEWTAADVMDKPIIPVFFKIEHIPPLLRSRLGVEFDQFNIDATVDKIHQLILKKVKEKKR